MSNSNMINPANYYNPFAKYNYVSKTRGVYMPKDTEPLLNVSDYGLEKSSSICSSNYDAETDVLQSMNKYSEENGLSNKILGFINKLFPSDTEHKNLT